MVVFVIDDEEYDSQRTSDRCNILTMNDRVAAVVRHLSNQGVDPAPLTFSAEVRTAVTAAAEIGCEVGAIANSLILATGSTTEDEAVLVLASGANRVDTKHVASLLDVPKLRLAPPDLVFRVTGQEVGGVAPCGHPAPLRTILDTDLRHYPEIWVSGGDHNTVLPISFDDLQRVTGAIEASVVGGQAT